MMGETELYIFGNKFRQVKKWACTMKPKYLWSANRNLGRCKI
jgi:hypothetical protein